MGARVSRRSSVVGDVGEFVEIINVRSEKTNCTNQKWPVLVCKNQVQPRELFREQVLTSVVVEDRNTELRGRRGEGAPWVWEVYRLRRGGGLPGQADPKHGTGQE